MSEGKPGGEYSREAYNAAEQEVEAKGQSEEKRAGLHEMAWDEALEVNKQYDELYSRKDQIDQEIVSFRREKLGMGEAKEVERTEPTLEQQAAVYAKMFDVDPAVILEAAQGLQAEMNEDEKRELTMLVYGPEGLTPAKAWKMIAAENRAWGWFNPAEIKTKGETNKAFVAFMHRGQEADEDSLGENAKSAKDWEKTGASFASPEQLMVARISYLRTEGKPMDEKNGTMCPGSRVAGGVPCLFFNPVAGRVDLSERSPEDRHPYLGVRRVVSKEL